MDLRKCILKKTQSVLADSSFGNVSNISIYESAAEETDNSIYFSFTEDSPSKSVDSALLDTSQETDFSNVSRGSDIDKENTIIERETGIKITVQGPTPERMISASPKVPEIKILSPTPELKITEEPIFEQTVTDNSKSDHVETKVPEIRIQGPTPERRVSASPKVADVKCSPTQTKEEEVISEQTVTDNSESDRAEPNQISELIAESKTEEVVVAEHKLEKADSIGHPPILSMEDAMIVDRETISPLHEVEIIVEDVNGDKINPFTSPDQVDVASALDEACPVVEKRPTRRSSIVLQTKARFYSPVLRKSLDRKAKAMTKLAANPRRTLYEPTRAAPSKPTGKTPTRIPKPAAKTSFKPKALKCPAPGCTNEFMTAKALVDHQKTHKPQPSASQDFKCKWCDKSFQLNSALFNHQTEKCMKIPAAEKRKVLAQQETKEKVRRRTTIFAAPMSMKKSPRKLKASTPMNKTLNKSGVSITPKKSLKCHICKEIIPDALGLANHILSHKFEKQKRDAEKETA